MAVYYADFETTSYSFNKDKASVSLWGIKNSETGEFWWGTSIESFFQFIIDNNITEIYFHNLKFDGNFIYKKLLKMGIKFYNGETKHLPDKHMAWLNNREGRLMQINVKFGNKIIDLPITTTFKCSYLQLMNSVDKLGKSLNMNSEKIKVDYEEFIIFENKEQVPQHLVEYLERDIDIVIKAKERIEEVVKFKMTASSTSLQHFKEFYGEREYSLDFGGKFWSWNTNSFEKNYVLSTKDYDFVKNSYQGGYVNAPSEIINRMQKVLGVSLDEVSAYPAQMLKQKMPYGRMLKTKPIGDSICLKSVFIFSAIIKKEYEKCPIIKEQHNSKYGAPKYLKELYNEERTYWEDELDYISKIYDINYTIVEKRYFKTKLVFNEWVKEMSKNKINASESGDDVLKDFWKLILNSHYGKYGQNWVIDKRIIREDGMRVFNYDKEGNPIFYINKEGEKVTKCPWRINQHRYGEYKEFIHDVEVERDEDKVVAYIPIASYITWLARKALFDVIFPNLDIWLYSDTDSCYFRDIPKGIKIGTQLGDWNYEYKFTKFKVLRAKCYMFYATHKYVNGEWKELNKWVKKISGLSTSGKEQVNEDNFKLGGIIRKGKRQLLNVDGGVLIVDKDYTFGRELEESGD